MDYILVAILSVVVLQAAAIGALLVREARLARDERVLRQGAEQFRLMVDRAPVILWTARPDSTLDYVNRTCTDFTGMPLEKMLDEGWQEAVHPDDLDRLVNTYAPAFEARVPFLGEYRVRGADGVYRWLLAKGVPRYGPDGDFTGFIGCDLDISERKQAEDRMRESNAALELSHREIQQLAGRLIAAQDAERARMARDLHDDVSQQLAGLAIALSDLEHRMVALGTNEKVQADVRALHNRTTVLAQSVRDLSHDLHPTVLQHAGLVMALTSHCAEVERLYGMASSCSVEGDFGSLAPQTALCLYRVTQEALRNVIAHAGATRAEVRLFHNGDHAELTIADDGRGFDVARPGKEGKGLGLVSLTERVRLAGGTLDIAAEAGKGTRIHVRVPTIRRA